jgi:hypothetical protein
MEGEAEEIDGDETFLRIYMNDQCALGVLWREFAKRAAANNRGSELGGVLEDVARAIGEDVATFEDLMRRLGVTANPVKPALAVVLERIGRLKPNGRLLAYSPLSRFAELDFLAIGIDGKKQLWATLRDLAGLGGRLPDVDFEHLIERAEAQRRAIEPFRVEAGRKALGPSAPTTGPALTGAIA